MLSIALKLKLSQPHITHARPGNSAAEANSVYVDLLVSVIIVDFNG